MHRADRGAFFAGLADRLRRRSLRYGWALLAIVVAAVLRYRLDVAFGYTQPFIFFYPTIMLISLLAGLEPSLLATAASATIAWLFLLEPRDSFAVVNQRDVIGLLVFVGMSVIMSVAGDLFRRRAQRMREFEKAVEGLKEMIVVVDRDYRYLIANEAFLDYRGMKKEDLIGRQASEILNPGVFENEIKPKLDECFRGNIVRFEMRYRYPHRGERELLVKYFPIKGAGGIDRVAIVLQDITDEREAESSLRLFRALIDQSNDAVEVVDPETLRFLDVNETACRQLGYTREELLSMRVPEVDLCADEAQFEKSLAQLREFGFLVREGRHQRKDGSAFPVEISLRLVELERTYIVALSRDISERKQAEETLRESEDRYRDLVEHTEDLVCTHDLEGRMLSVNPAPARALGYEVSELLKIPMREVVAPEFREGFDQYLERIQKNGADEGLLCVVTRGGERRVWEYRNTLRTEGVAKPIVRGMAHDITERKRAEEALRRREQDYRSFVAKSSEGIFREELDAPLSIDLPEDELIQRIMHDSCVAECNDAMARMYGFDSSRELVGKRLTELLPADDARNIEMTREYVRGGFRVIDRESHELDLAGNPKVFRNSILGIVENGKLVRTWGIQRDVTEQCRLEEARGKAEEALRESETHFRVLVEQASDGIFIGDPQGRYIDVNTAAAEMLGYTREELLQLSIADIVTKDEIERIPLEVARYAGGVTARSDWKFLRKDGSVFPGEVCGKQLPDGRLQGILRDMTERHQAEEETRRSEERFRVALKDSPITVFNQDEDLRYTWIYNPQLYWQHEVIGKTDGEILGPERATVLTSLKQRVLTSRVALHQDVTIPHNGRSYAFDMTIEPLFDAEGNAIGITGACVDIARLREMTNRLQDAKEKLTQAKSYLESEIQAELGFKEIIGQSAALREVLKEARVVAPTDSTVLLLGETGTGKELVARAVHALSDRHGQTFVKLNCAAVPSGLLESELFGHEKGAFTGAVSQKAGRIELADKGTLFLDEIGELPPELQPKLLRVLQDREFERLGGVQTKRVDVRIIAATNRDLRQDIEDKRFREDLFYRLNVFPIELPPLRERREDIAMLVLHFMRKHAARMGRQITTIPDETMRILQNWNWPGNIRELENMIERMVILTKGSVLTAPPAELEAWESSEDNLTEMERDHIIRVLRETNGVLSGTAGAANRLGVKRTTLQSMLKRFGIEAQEFRRGNGTFGGE
jgi:formate hydrogenlyase transcriptional activator